MSTKKVTTNTNQYTSQATQAQNTLSNTYTQMVQNPFSGPQYQMGLQQQMNAANQLNANNIRNSLNAANMAGAGNLTGGARMSLLSGLGRQASGTRQQGFFNNWNTAVSQQQFGANVLGNLSGQLAGSTSTQTTSGVGTWLPQILGGALSFGTSLLNGGGTGGGQGMSVGTPGGPTGNYGAWTAATSPMQPGVGGTNNPYQFQQPNIQMPSSSSPYLQF
jgi:hypothetical protein